MYHCYRFRENGKGIILNEAFQCGMQQEKNTPHNTFNGCGKHHENRGMFFKFLIAGQDFSKAKTVRVHETHIRATDQSLKGSPRCKCSTSLTRSSDLATVFRKKARSFEARSCYFPNTEFLLPYIGFELVPLAPFGAPVWNPFLNFLGTSFMYRIRPVPVVFLLFAFMPQLSVIFVSAGSSV